ncbi:MAG: hypothetical protein ACOC59_00495, partial [Bacteroidota bacterium]
MGKGHGAAPAGGHDKKRTLPLRPCQVISPIAVGFSVIVERSEATCCRRNDVWVYFLGGRGREKV